MGANFFEFFLIGLPTLPLDFLAALFFLFLGFLHFFLFLQSLGCVLHYNSLEDIKTIAFSSNEIQ